MSSLWEPFLDSGELQRALGAAALLGLVCGLLGALVMPRGLTYAAESLSHALLPGAAVALLAGGPVLVGALVSGVGAAGAVARLSRRRELADSGLGVVFTASLAATALLMAGRGGPEDLEGLLFGDIGTVQPIDLWLGLAVLAGAVGFVATLGRRFVISAFDPAFASALRLRPALLDALLLALLAAALAIGLRSVGGLLVLALLVAPAAAAQLVSRRLRTMMWLAPVLGLLSSAVGLEISIHAAVGAGPAIALVSLGAFALAGAWTGLRHLLRHPTRPDRSTAAPAAPA
jgi:ABC-type Mn2+/Zn2+ transport system permease subunit